MSVLVRRFIIVALVCTNFAILFAALVEQSGARAAGPRYSLPQFCTAPNSGCGVVL